MLSGLQQLNQYNEPPLDDVAFWDAAADTVGVKIVSMERQLLSGARDRNPSGINRIFSKIYYTLTQTQFISGKAKL
jgi:hypothetical protein